MPLSIYDNVSLTEYSTMRLGGRARHLIHIASKDELLKALGWAEERSLNVLMIGGGANIIFRDEGFDGVVLVNIIEGLELESHAGGDRHLNAGAGEVWDDVVAYAVEHSLTGIESLSLIPGKTGAAAVQNIGAYGQDISQTLHSLEAYDLKSRRFVTLSHADCDFGYRSSRFNRADKGRFLITSLTFHLQAGVPSEPYYKDVERYLAEHPPAGPVTPAVIREAVTAIRTAKLPNPAIVANTGSFFYNPVITRAEWDRLVAAHPELDQTPEGWPQPPRWFQGDGSVKLSAGRLIELAGFKAYDDPATGMAIWPKQNLVLINKAAKSTADLLAFKAKLVDGVSQKFGITIEQEPELI